MAKELSACPCGGLHYASCCGRYHAGELAPDAESLMRSRYSAYALKLESYLLDTWHTSTRPTLLELAADPAKWMGLEIRHHLKTDADHASVEFVARYKLGGRAYRLHEISQFIREETVWFYVDGYFPETDK